MASNHKSNSFKIMKNLANFNTIKKNIVLFLFFPLLFSISCKKEIIQKDPLTKTMTNLDISASFDWNTTKAYVFTLSGAENRMVSIASTAGIVYQKGMILQNEPFKTTIHLPGYVKTIQFLYAGRNVEYQLSGSTINYTFQ